MALLCGVYIGTQKLGLLRMIELVAGIQTRE
jgi:hypothetical protein